MIRRFLSIVFLLNLLYLGNLIAGEMSSDLLLQRDFEGMPDKCGYDSLLEARMKVLLGKNWGYSYDSLLADLARWSQSPYIQIDSIGASVQNRALWQLTITSDSPTRNGDKHTIFIHARTHPSEVQAFWVTDAIIDYLRSEEPLAQLLRQQCTFYIIPMYNPDGVELGYARQNANHVDLERNWDTPTPEPEVAALRARFLELMNSPEPIEVALNMHSSYLCTRYFVYHDSAGTSPAFTVLEQNFINSIRYYYPNGIEPWDYFISWTSGTPTYYPESWFWLNYAEAVMALTYEDMNCAAAGNYDSTAYAILHGIADYLGLVTTPVARATSQPGEIVLHQNYPNPFNSGTYFTFRLPEPEYVDLSIFNSLGQRVKSLYSGRLPAGMHQIYWNGQGETGRVLPSGVYFYRLKTRHSLLVRKMMLVK